MYIKKVPTPEDFDRVVNSIWAEVSKAQKWNVHPNLAMNYIRAMWKAETGRKFPWKIRIGTGNRHTWLRSGVFTVNPDQGWYEINHFMAHFIERRLTGEAHSNAQLRRERNGAHMIVRKFLRDEPYVEPKKLEDKVSLRAVRVDANIKRWEAKLKRAANALKKLKTKKRYYDKVLTERGS